MGWGAAGHKLLLQNRNGKLSISGRNCTLGWEAAAGKGEIPGEHRPALTPRVPGGQGAFPSSPSHGSTTAPPVPLCLFLPPAKFAFSQCFPESWMDWGVSWCHTFTAPHKCNLRCLLLSQPLEPLGGTSLGPVLCSSGFIPAQFPSRTSGALHRCQG